MNLGEVFVGHGILSELGPRLKDTGFKGTVFLISDDQVGPLYAAAVTDALAREGFRVNSYFVPAGEKSKSLEQAARLYNWLIDNRAERQDGVLALGGGVVGDLAGFVAATFARGIALIQVPTTLLAQVDASIGGKVAINHPQGKNLIGAFHQPSLVFTDTSFLQSLPPRELTAGWAEVIKTAFISDAEFVVDLEQSAAQLQRLEPSVTVEIIRRCVEFKLSVVSEDEREQGRRMILNYGHTIGHAIEAAAGYEGFLHGEAVAIGMVGAARIADRLGYLRPEDVSRHISLLRKFDLPIGAPGLDRDVVLKAMEVDKKTRGASINWVLLKGIGHPEIIKGVPMEVVTEVLDGLFSLS